MTAAGDLAGNARQQLKAVVDILRELRDGPWRIEFVGPGQPMAEGTTGVVVTKGGHRITLDLLIDLARASVDGLVWVVGKQNNEDGTDWDFQDVFTNQFLAEVECQDRLWFVAPATMNQALPVDRSVWPGLYRPNQAEPAKPAAGDARRR